MNPAQMIRALGTAAHLAGLDDFHETLVAFGESASHVDVLELLELLEERVDAEVPRPVRAAMPEPVRRSNSARAAALAGNGWSDRKIATALGITVEGARSARRRAGVPGNPTARPRSGWEDRIRSAVERKLTTDEIMAETGWSRRTVQSRLCALGLTRRR